jgi:hypothetical protein
VVAAAAGVVCIAAAVAVTFIPRDSAAADLRAVADALQSMPPRTESHYVDKGNGEFELELTLTVDDDEAVLEQRDAATQVWKDDRLLVEFDGYATVQDAKKPEWAFKTLVLREWLNRAVEDSIKRKVLDRNDLQFDVAYRDIKLKSNVVVQRFVFDTVVLDAKGQELRGEVKFDVDAATLKPILVRTRIATLDPVQIKLDYNVVDLKLDRTIPVPVRLYDIDEQRRQITDSFDSPVATSEVGAEKVLLHCAVLDHDGNLTFIYSETESVPTFLDRSKVLDPGMQDLEAPTLSLMPGTIKDGVYKLEPVLFKGRRVGIVSLKLKKEWAGATTIGKVSLPVVKGGIEHFVEFLDVPLMLTGNSLMLLAPENVPFFVGGTIVKVGKILSGQ